jgi:hypothetical protein
MNHGSAEEVLGDGVRDRKTRVERRKNGQGRSGTAARFGEEDVGFLVCEPEEKVINFDRGMKIPAILRDRPHPGFGGIEEYAGLSRFA